MFKRLLGSWLLVLFSRLFLGGLFLSAGWSKLRDMASFADSVAAYQILPLDLVWPFANLLAAAECLLGVLLVGGIFTQAAAACAILLLCGFLAALGSALVRGLEIGCGCQTLLGGAGTVHWSQLLWNSGLLLMAIHILLWDQGRLGLGALLGKEGPGSSLPARTRAGNASFDKLRGFTLLELIVVVIVITMLAGILAVVIFGVMDDAKKSRARQDLRHILTGMTKLKADTGDYSGCGTGTHAGFGTARTNWIRDPFFGLLSYSTTSCAYNGWNGTEKPYVDPQIQKDPWGQEFHYHNHQMNSSTVPACPASAGAAGPKLGECPVASYLMSAGKNKLFDASGTATAPDFLTGVGEFPGDDIGFSLEPGYP